MHTPKDQPLKLKIYGLSACLGVALVSALFFGMAFFNLMDQLSQWPRLFELEKRGFYGLGPFVALMALSYSIYKEAFVGRSLSGKERSILGKVLSLSIVLTFLIPFAIRSVAIDLLEDRGYERCERTSGYSIRLASDFYAMGKDACTQFNHSD